MNLFIRFIRHAFSWEPPVTPRLFGDPAPVIPQEWAAGHYYSPIPSPEDLKRVSLGRKRPVLAIDFNEAAEAAILTEMKSVYAELKFPVSNTPGRRYFYDNESFGALDAICLATMIRKYKPKRILEVGSGFSSAAILDLRDDGLFDPQQLTFIDPDTARIEALISQSDKEHIRLLEQPVQDVALEEFEKLESGDILFIDSSHVSKAGSDVNFLIFEVLPRLAPGVVVHIHDVCQDFEYPKNWLESGRYWNEQYLLRAFLMYNQAFEVVLLSVHAFGHNKEFFRTEMPITSNGGGGQLWLRRR